MMITIYTRVRILTFTILAVFLLVPHCWAATYYVDATNGRDTNVGLSEATAWKTIAKVNSSQFLPGDQILFKRGEVWRAQLTVPSSGTAGKPITLGVYGSGAKPIIDASNLIAPGTSWTEATPTIWVATVTTEPKIVFFNGTKGIKVLSRADCKSMGKWHWAANVLSVFSATDPDTAYTSPGIEVGARDQALWNEKNYTIIDGLHFRRGNKAAGWTVFSSGSHNIFQNNEVSFGAHHGFAGLSTGDDLVTNNTIHNNGNGTAVDSAGIFSYKNAATEGHENYFSHNTIYNNRCFGIYLISNYNIVEHNDIYDNGNIVDMCTGIEIWNGDNDGFARYNTVRYNKLYGQKSGTNNGEGLLFDDYSAHNTAYYNIAYGNDAAGFGIWRGNHNSMYNNIAYGNSLNSSGALTTKTEFAIDADGANLTDHNILKNNIAYATQANTYAIWIGPFSNNSADMGITNNLWYATAANWYFWNVTAGATLATWNGYTPVGTDLNADPLFVSATDFHLQPASLAINAGTDVGLTRDYQGQKVPLGGAPDIGAYEYGPSSVLLAPTGLRIFTP